MLFTLKANTRVLVWHVLFAAGLTWLSVASSGKGLFYDWSNWSLVPEGLRVDSNCLEIVGGGIGISSNRRCFREQKYIDMFLSDSRLWDPTGLRNYPGRTYPLCHLHPLDNGWRYAALGFVVANTRPTWRDGGRVGVGAPLWFFWMLVLAWPLWFARCAFRRLPENFRCERCGYDLRASKCYCPECGTPLRGGKDEEKEPEKVAATLNTKR